MNASSNSTGGELAEGSLASPAVVGVLDPHEDRVGELIADEAIPELGVVGMDVDDGVQQLRIVVVVVAGAVDRELPLACGADVAQAAKLEAGCVG